MSKTDAAGLRFRRRSTPGRCCWCWSRRRRLLRRASCVRSVTTRARGRTQSVNRKEREKGKVGREEKQKRRVILFPLYSLIGAPLFSLSQNDEKKNSTNTTSLTQSPRLLYISNAVPSRGLFSGHKFSKKEQNEFKIFQTSSTLTSPSSLVSRSLTRTNGPPSASHSRLPSR